MPTTRSADRWDRSRRLDWFDLARAREARVLIAGAGALGNEVVKNLALSGVGHVTLVDPDRVDETNLNRCVFFTADDASERREKAAAVAAGAARLNPGTSVSAVSGRVEDLSEGAFREADVVLSCVDNVATRLHLNAHARKAGTPLVDGGTHGLLGKVQVVAGPEAPCVECGVNVSHRKVLEERYACTGADVSYFEPLVAAEITTTSVVAAVQAREAVKAIHGLWERLQRGILYYDGFNSRFDLLELARNPRCPHHEVNPQ